MTRHIWIKVNWITNRNEKKIFCKKEKNVIKSWLNFFAFQVFWMKKVCDEFYHDGTKKCDNRLFHAKAFHETFSCFTFFCYTNSFVR